jgi:hypothetical protein
VAPSPLGTSTANWPIVEQSVEWELAGETQVLGENLPQTHFVHHKSRMTLPGLELWADAVVSLSYGTAKLFVSL